MQQWNLITDSAEQTEALGRLVGALIECPAAILLRGDLGAGKTCFTRGLARGLGVPEDEPVTSPSYTLMNHYRGRLDFYHFDLYRLSGPDDLIDLGFEDYLHGDGVAVVEWSERTEGMRPDGLDIALAYEGEHRRSIAFCAHGPVFEELLTQLAKAWPQSQKDG